MIGIPRNLPFVLLLFSIMAGIAPAQQASPAEGDSTGSSERGEIAGRITLAGPIPVRKRINVDSDPVCVQTGGIFLNEEIVVSEGRGLANVFIYVSGGLEAEAFPASFDTVVIEQSRCRFAPRVAGARVGQIVRFVNSDGTFHNVHALAGRNTPFNLPMAMPGNGKEKAFTLPEVMIPIMCDVHGWESAYIGVLDHPYFTVSDSSGRYTIEGLPDGRYTVTAWHEKLGTREGTIDLHEGRARLDFTFTAGKKSRTDD